MILIFLYENNIFHFYYLAGQQSYLVRPSETSPGNYTLYFYVDNRIHRYRIIQIDKYFHIGGRIFDSISSIIDRYKHEDLMEGNRKLLEWNFNKYQNEYNLKTKNNKINHNNSNDDDDEDEDIEIDEEEEEGNEEEIEIGEDIDDDQHLNIFEDLINNNNNIEKEEVDEEHMITIDVQSSILVNDLFITSTIQQNNNNNNISFDLFTRKTDQVPIKGNLLKYSNKNEILIINYKCLSLEPQIEELKFMINRTLILLLIL